MMIYFDLETTVNGGPDGDSPEAHWSNNRVLMCGFHQDGELEIYENTDVLASRIQNEIDYDGHCVLVAHNAKFDIKYLMRDHPEVEWHNVQVWDTMTWEYLGSGHRETFISLEDAASKYGISFTKSLDLGTLLSNGVKMEDIPKDELQTYLEGDVKVLVELQVTQEQQATYWMDHILPLAEMELNGLRLKQQEATDLAIELTHEADEAHETIRDYIMAECEWQDGSSVIVDDFSDLITPKGKHIKPTANRTVSFLFTGVPAELKITPKWRLKLKGDPVLSTSQVDKIYDDIKPSHLGYPVDEDALDKMTKELGSSLLLEQLLKYRKAHKVTGTYLLPMLRQAKIEGTVHPKLNTAITSTGRLSSSAPNGQNMPPEVRELIEAEDWRSLEEVDFSQLEMVGAATTSACPDLIYDLTHGVDIHAKTGTKVFGAAQAKAKRKLAKNVNFGVLYGGKANGLSKQTGIDKDVVQELIDAFYDSYPGVKQAQEDLFQWVKDNKYAYDIRDGEQRYACDYILPVSGRKFRFIETKAPPWLQARIGKKYSFSPNHTANYPIQGFAGGDIVMFGLWHLWHQLRKDITVDKVQFRLTVHDSILLEKPASWDLTMYYNDMNDAIKDRFNLPVDLHVDVETGPTWS